MNSDIYENQFFIDNYADEIPFQGTEDRRQFAYVNLHFINENDPIFNNTIYKVKGKSESDISDQDYFDIINNYIVDDQFLDYPWEWHWQRFILTFPNDTWKNLLTDDEIKIFTKKLSSYSNFNKELPFLLEGTKFRTERAKGEEILTYKLKLEAERPKSEKIINYLIRYLQKNPNDLKMLEYLSENLKLILEERYNIDNNELMKLWIYGLAYIVKKNLNFYESCEKTTEIDAKEMLKLESESNVKVSPKPEDFPFHLNDVKTLTQRHYCPKPSEAIQLLLIIDEPLNNEKIELEIWDKPSFWGPNKVQLLPIDQFFSDHYKEFQSWDTISRVLLKHRDLFDIAYRALPPPEPNKKGGIQDRWTPAQLVKQDIQGARKFAEKALSFFYDGLTMTYDDINKDTWVKDFLKYQDQLIEAVMNLQSSSIENKVTLLCCIDTEKAYSTAWHMLEKEKLIFKYPHYTIAGHIIDIYEGFSFENFFKLLESDPEPCQIFNNSNRLVNYASYNPTHIHKILHKHPGDLIFFLPASLSKISSENQDIRWKILYGEHQFIPVIEQYFEKLENDLIKKANEKHKAHKHYDDENKYFIKSDKIRLLLAVGTVEAIEKAKVEYINSHGYTDFVSISFKIMCFSPSLGEKWVVEALTKGMITSLEMFTYLVTSPFYYRKIESFVSNSFPNISKMMLDDLPSIRPKIKVQQQCSDEQLKRRLVRNLCIAAYKGNKLSKEEWIKIETDWTGEENPYGLKPEDRVSQDITEIETRSSTENIILRETTNSLFLSDLEKMREQLHQTYQKFITTPCYDLRIVYDIIRDAKNEVLKKAKKALIKEQISEKTTMTILNHFQEDDSYPSRPNLEKIFKEYEEIKAFDKKRLEAILTRCSDEILPKLLKMTLETLVNSTHQKVIFDDEKHQTPLAEFLQIVYPDYPQPWMKGICNIFENYQNIHDKWLKGLSLALGHLREPWGKKVPVLLNKAVNDPDLSDDLREFIKRQKNLFNGENFNRGHHRDPLRRVSDCRNTIFKTHRMITEFKE